MSSSTNRLTAQDVPFYMREMLELDSPDADENHESTSLPSLRGSVIAKVIDTRTQQKARSELLNPRYKPTQSIPHVCPPRLLLRPDHRKKHRRCSAAVATVCDQSLTLSPTTPSTSLVQIVERKVPPSIWNTKTTLMRTNTVALMSFSVAVDLE